MVKNGGFECGLAPWVFAGGPNYSYRFFRVGDNSPQEIVLEGRTGSSTFATLSQNVSTTVGQKYSLTYRTATDGCANAGDVVALRALLNNEVVDYVDECSLPRGVHVGRAVGEFRFRPLCEAHLFLSPPFIVFLEVVV